MSIVLLSKRHKWPSRFSTKQKIFLLTELPQKHNGPWQAKGREQFLEQATAR